MIKNLDEKLEGKLSVTRSDLFELISSWGRIDNLFTIDGIEIHKCEPNEKYPLENLDISKINNFTFLFANSLYNGDLSNWNTSNVSNMSGMFWGSKFNNDSLNNWNLSNVEKIDFIFYKSIFNGDLSNWNVSNIINFESSFDNCPFDGDISKWQFNQNVDCFYIFYANYNFINKYNTGNDLPDDSQKFLKWFEKNREKIKEINTPKQEILDFFDFNEKDIELL